jgi:hypothetical protein
MMDGTDKATTFAPEPEASMAWSRRLHAVARRDPRMNPAELMRLLGDPGKSVGIDAAPETADGRPQRERKASRN